MKMRETIKNEIQGKIQMCNGLLPFISLLFHIQNVGLTSMRICVKDLTGSGSKHDPLSVSYVVIGGWY